MPSAFLVLPVLVAQVAQARELVDFEPEQGFSRIRYDFGGFVQPRFSKVPEDETEASPGQIGFVVRRARIELKGIYDTAGEASVEHKVSWELMPEPRLVDAYIDVGPNDAVRLRWGQFKTPTSRSMLVSDRRTLFPDRGEILNMTPQRDIGAQLHGELGDHHFEWATGVFNGEGTNRIENVNRKFLYAWRAVVSPIGSPGTTEELMSPDQDTTFSLGYSGFFNVEGPEGSEEARIAHTAEGFAHWRWITVQGEWLWGFADWEPTAVADYNSTGWYVQTGIFLPAIPWAQDHIALLGKYEQVEEYDPIDAEVPLVSAQDEAQARRNTWVGVGYYVGAPYFRSIHTLRLQVAYGMKEELEDRPYDNNELQVAAHMSF
jgi:hypothetical protein